MAMTKRLNANNISLNNEAKTKDDILKFITSKTAPLLANHGEEEILGALTERERMSSTGLGEGIAIPHCSLDNIDDFLIGLIVTKDKIEFNSLDKKPVNLFFYLIGPKEQRNLHISLLSSISKLMIDKKTRQKFVDAKDPQDILNIIMNSEGEQPKKEEEAPNEKCMVQIFVQDEDKFDDILQIMTSRTESSVSVIEGENAGKYLHSLPLFSSFWNDGDRRFHRIICGIIDKHACNETVRRIRLLFPQTGEPEGVLIAVQELLYTGGSLDF